MNYDNEMSLELYFDLVNYVIRYSTYKTNILAMIKKKKSTFQIYVNINIYFCFGKVV